MQKEDHKGSWSQEQMNTGERVGTQRRVRDASTVSNPMGKLVRGNGIGDIAR